MPSYDIRPLQLRILEALKAFHSLCQVNGLRYFITAGTMLGAVRHGGFIPWDDDLDIAMPRRDYDLLIANSRHWLPKHLELVCAETDPSYPLPFAKIQDASTTILERPHLPYLGGVYMDVFPLDGVPKESLVRRLHFAKYEYYKRALYLIHRDPYKHGHGPSSWIPLLTRLIYSPQGIQTSIRTILKKYDYDNSRFIADYDDGLGGIMDRDIVMGEPTIIKFEDTQVFGYQNPELYLTQKYGNNYMQIPAAAQQRQHNFFYLDLTTPYRESRTKIASLLRSDNGSKHKNS